MRCNKLHVKVWAGDYNFQIFIALESGSTSAATAFVVVRLAADVAIPADSSNRRRNPPEFMKLIACLALVGVVIAVLQFYERTQKPRS